MLIQSSNKMLKLTLSLAVLLCIGYGSISTAKMDGLTLGLVVSNYPNPFDSRNENTTIVYSVSQEGSARMLIYDLLGNLVKEYPSNYIGIGTNKVMWDGTNEAGQKVAKGGDICVVEIINDSNRILTVRKIGVIH